MITQIRTEVCTTGDGTKYFTVFAKMPDGQKYRIDHLGAEGLDLHRLEVTYLALKRELRRQLGQEPDYLKKIREEIA